MLLGGLWHGASWTFVVWGGLHGLFLCVQRWWDRYLGFLVLWCPAALRKLVAMGFVFSSVCVAWVFFRAQSFHDAWTVLARIAAMQDMSFSAVEQKFQVVKGMGLIAGVVAVEALSFKMDYWLLARRWPILVGLFLLICLLAISVLGNFNGNAFIYFQF